MSETLDHTLRGILGFGAFVSVLLAARFFGAIWPERSAPIRMVCVGLFAVLVYVLAGQAKAFLYNIRFDWFSAVGLFAYMVLDAGLVWFHLRERRVRRGR